MTRISVSKMRRELSDVLNRVAFGGERVVVRRNKKDVAALVSIQDFAFLTKMAEELEDRLDVQAALDALACKESISLKDL